MASIIVMIRAMNKHVQTGLVLQGGTNVEMDLHAYQMNQSVMAKTTVLIYLMKTRNSVWSMTVYQALRNVQITGNV